MKKKHIKFIIIWGKQIISTTEKGMATIISQCMNLEEVKEKYSKLSQHILILSDISLKKGQ